MVVAEALAGIALVKSAVDGIKSAISTTNDIGQIAVMWISCYRVGTRQIKRSVMHQMTL